MSLSATRLGDLWGDRTALVDERADERVTYAELAAHARDAAGRLAALGVESGDAVAVVSRNRVECLVVLFAARRLGASFAPVSHRLTPATVTDPVERIDPAVVLHEVAQRDLVRGFDDTCSFEAFRHRERADHDPSPPAPGETLVSLVVDGEERRVLDLSRRAVERNCATSAAGWGLGRRDRALTLLPLSDADGLLRFVCPLLSVGGSVVLLRAFDPADALAAVERRGVTCATAGVTEFRELAGEEHRDDPDLSSVSWLATRTRVAPAIREAFPVPLVRAYGRPAAGVDLLRGTPDEPETASRPFPGVELRLDGGQATPESDVGELLARPPDVEVPADASGDGEGVEQWVATGDLFRRADGRYERVGRVDERFEYEGRSVHPRTVEAVLEAAPGVLAAGVFPGDDGAPRAVVVGDVAADEDTTADDEVATDAVREFAVERLAAHEVPQAVEVGGALPRRPTGDLDRAALRERFGGDKDT
ncbi:class I adenylate-forming enzyme family protein [Halomicrococcus gelatinilyticus]|uniref:class I adenylate-forming enzyme family protein n=1 Tax=Halomicrococcus gelatinilyticus TaxID=1702103 RepID=UPI002E0E3C0E